MGMHQYLTFLPVGAAFLIWVAVVAYLLFLATRLVRAVEEIARKTGG